MVREYTEAFYLIGHNRFLRLSGSGAERARLLAAWLERIQSNWAAVRVESVTAESPGTLSVGERFRVEARVRLGELTAEDVTVELCMGPLDPSGEIRRPVATQMEAAGRDEQGRILYVAESVACCRSGLHGFTVRVLPFHPDLSGAFLPGLITWA
jgi:starch phosphorylase